jgi:hypothetical protein
MAVENGSTRKKTCPSATLPTTVTGLQLGTVRSEVDVNNIKVKFLPHSKHNCSAVTTNSRLMPSIERITELYKTRIHVVHKAHRFEYHIMWSVH